MFSSVKPVVEITFIIRLPPGPPPEGKGGGSSLNDLPDIVKFSISGRPSPSTPSVGIKLSLNG